MKIGILSLSSVLFIFFVFLKIGIIKTAIVSWSWWWITMPVWCTVAFLPVAIAAILIMLLSVIALCRLIELFCKFL